MNTQHASSRRLPAPRLQRGATLFTAMMILLLLTLLALSVAQVSGLQERMAGLYRTDAQAFETAEQQLRNREVLMLDEPMICDEGYRSSLPVGWDDGSVEQGVITENLQSPNSSADPSLNSVIGGSMRAGQDRTPGGASCLTLRVTSLSGDQPTDPTSSALVQSIYVP